MPCFPRPKISFYRSLPSIVWSLLSFTILGARNRQALHGQIIGKEVVNEEEDSEAWNEKLNGGGREY